MPGSTNATDATAQASILSLIRAGRASTRAELIALTGLSRSTVSQRLDALLASGLVVPAGEASSTGGRPATLLSFNGGIGVVLAANFGATEACAAVVDLSGSVLAESRAEHLISDGPVPTLDWATRRFEELLRQANRSFDDVWGVGIGLPGPVEFSSGRPVSPPIMPGWDNFPVSEWLGDRLGAPVFVDNDVNVMAMGERSLYWQDCQDLIFVKIGTGIGAGIIVGGKLYRGAQGSAGNLGHVHLQGHAEVICECGHAGCLEAVAGGRAIARQLSAAGIPTATARQVVERVRVGEPTALRAVRDAGREVGAALAAVVHLLNPEVIVVGGSMSEAGDHLIAGVRELVYQLAPPLATRDLRILASRAGDHAGVIGCAAMTAEQVLGRGSREIPARPRAAARVKPTKRTRRRTEKQAS